MPRDEESQPAGHDDVHIKQDLVGTTEGGVGEQLQSPTDEINSSEGDGSYSPSSSVQDVVSGRQGRTSSLIKTDQDYQKEK